MHLMRNSNKKGKSGKYGQHNSIYMNFKANKIKYLCAHLKYKNMNISQKYQSVV